MGQPRRPDQQFTPPVAVTPPSPSSGIFVGRRIIIFATGMGNGLFEYSGTPAVGNLPIYYIVAPGTTADPSGNTLPVSGGAVSLSGAAWVQMLNGQINFFEGSFISQGAGGLMILGGTAGTNGIEILMPVLPGVAAIEPGTEYTAETWHSLGTLADFTVNVGVYRITLEGDLKLWVSVTSGGSNDLNTAFSVTLPTDYIPNTALSQPMATGTSAIDNLGAFITVATSGVVTVTFPASTVATAQGCWIFPLAAP